MATAKQQDRLDQKINYKADVCTELEKLLAKLIQDALSLRLEVERAVDELIPPGTEGPIDSTKGAFYASLSEQGLALTKIIRDLANAQGKFKKGKEEFFAVNYHESGSIHEGRTYDDLDKANKVITPILVETVKSVLSAQVEFDRLPEAHVGFNKNFRTKTEAVKDSFRAFATFASSIPFLGFYRINFNKEPGQLKVFANTAQSIFAVPKQTAKQIEKKLETEDMNFFQRIAYKFSRGGTTPTA